MLFDNQTITISELPIIEDKDYISIDLRYKKYLFKRNTIFFIVPIIALIVFQLLSDIEVDNWIFWLAYNIIIAFWIISMGFVQLGFSHKGYILRKHDIVYKTGYIFRKTTAVPKNRIQHLEIRQGIMLRMFGLSKLVLFTAGGGSSDLLIPGLMPKTAEALKEEISLKIADNE